MDESIPRRSPLPENAGHPSSTDELTIILEKAHAQYLSNLSGEPADYIPELAKVPPDDFGIALGLPSGRVVAVGHAAVAFTIQSISKAFSYAFLVDMIGAEATAKVVGVQPSSDPFNTIALDAVTHRRSTPWSMPAPSRWPASCANYWAPTPSPKSSQYSARPPAAA